MQHPADVDEAALLGRLPAPHRHALSSCLGFAQSTNRFSIAVHGSLGGEETDEFSDLDLWFAYDGEATAAEALQSFESMVSRIGTTLVRFDGSHVNSSDTHIIYCSCLDWIVKLDARLVPATRGFVLPLKSRILYDPLGRFRAFELQPPGVIDADMLFRKLCGWFWFTYGRLARGELLAAARSIDFSREHALLPLMLARGRMPQDGHRRVEVRLPHEECRRLYSTYPASLTREAIWRALRQLHALVVREMEHWKFGGQTAVSETLGDVWALIERTELARSVPN